MSENTRCILGEDSCQWENCKEVSGYWRGRSASWQSAFFDLIGIVGHGNARLLIDKYGSKTTKAMLYDTGPNICIGGKSNG